MTIDMLRRTLRRVTIFCAIALITMFGYKMILERKRARLESMHQQPAMGLGAVADFKFTERSGKPFGLSDLKGNYWVADFFFIRCMGPCPLLTTKMAQLQSEFKDKKNLRFVSFTVDPEYDKPRELVKYADNYGASKDRWFFLTGNKEKLFDLIRTSFHQAVENTNPAANDILHSLYFTLVDPDGNILGYYNTSEAADMDALRNIIAEKVS